MTNRDRPSRDTFVVEDVEQARVLLDPLRARLLRAFSGEPRTTKQVADDMGENPTRLYRHVDALRKAGLLVLKEERKKRGTVERYLQAVARRFEVNPALFSPDRPDSSKQEMVRSVFRSAETELLTGLGGSGRDKALSPLIAQFSGVTTREGYADLRAKLMKWIEEAGQEPGEGKATVRFSGLIGLSVTPNADSSPK